MISIHALVKRATVKNISTLQICGDFNPRPRKEGDDWTCLNGVDTDDFNPRPRKEGDKGGKIQLSAKVISIHALVKRATIRQQIHRKAWIYFNPRPRKEGDPQYRQCHYGFSDFNPRPRKEGDIVINGSWRYPSNFNPRPRKEGD